MFYDEGDFILSGLLFTQFRLLYQQKGRAAFTLHTLGFFILNCVLLRFLVLLVFC